MSLDFTTDINNVTRQIRSYIRRNEPIPKCTLDHYSSLVSASINSQIAESGSGDFPVGNLSSSFPSATTSNSVILSANTSRTYILIQNIGTETVYINFGGVAGVGAGIQLLPSATFITQVTQFTRAELNAISTSAPSSLAVFEIA